MGDLNKGETFAAGETVSAARLHRLVEDATLKAGVVTTTKIADGAITTAKLASSVSLTVSSVAISENKVLVGNASRIGAEVAVDTGTMNPAGFGVKALGIAAAQLAVDAVETAKIKDANVTLPKLAAQAASTIVANGTGGSASPTACPLGTGLEFSEGALRVTAAVSAGLVTKATTGTAAVPAAGSVATFAHGLGAVPAFFDVYLECTTIDAGYAVGQRVRLESLQGNGFRTPFAVYADGTNVKASRFSGSSEAYLWHATTGAEVTVTLSLATNWQLRFQAWA